MLLKGDVSWIGQSVRGSRKIEISEPHRAKLKIYGTAAGSEMRLGDVMDIPSLVR